MLLERVIAYVIEFIIAIVAGKVLIEWSQKKPKLVRYITNVSYFDIPVNQPGQTPLRVGTHTITIQNMGKAKAEEIEVYHNALPLYNVFPDTQCREEDTQQGKVLKFDSLLPKSSMIISYFYLVVPNMPNYLPIYVKSKEGYANEIQTIHTPIFPKWIRYLTGILIALGVVFILNIIYELIKNFL